MNKSKLIITGANGFLGKNTVHESSPQWDTYGIVRRKEKFTEITSNGGTPVLMEKFTVKELAELFTNSKAVINFLGIVAGTEEQFQKINVENFDMIVKAAEKAGVKRVICMSGLGVERYGETDWATNNYFKSKLKMEKILHKSSLDYTIFRPSYILGPHDELIPELIKTLKEGSINIIGPGTAPMQPIYVKNAINAILQACSGIGPNHATYDLVGPEIVSMMDLVSKVKASLEQFIELPETKFHHFTIEQAEKELDYPKEVSDIFFCDSLGDPNILKQDLQINLTSLDNTISQTVKTELGIKE